MAELPDTCASCSRPFTADRPACVDKYHRTNPICSECYKDPVRAKATADNPDDPLSWWNKPRRASAHPRSNPLGNDRTSNRT
jgi:hypothetical protein